MIKSFGDQATYDLFDTGEVPDKGCGWADVADVARRKLNFIEAAEKITDLWTPPGNKLKSLEGDLYSIRINDQWRIVFEWDDGDAENVEIIDYHD